MNELYEILNEAQRSVSYGTVFYALKKHDDNVTSIDVNKVSTYKTKDNVEALTIIGTLIKGVNQQIKDNPKTLAPSLTFTLFFHEDGQADRIQVNDFSRTSIK